MLVAAPAPCWIWNQKIKKPNLLNTFRTKNLKLKRNNFGSPNEWETFFRGFALNLVTFEREKLIMPTKVSFFSSCDAICDWKNFFLLERHFEIIIVETFSSVKSKSNYSIWMRLNKKVKYMLLFGKLYRRRKLRENEFAIFFNFLLGKCYGGWAKVNRFSDYLRIWNQFNLFLTVHVATEKEGNEITM